MCGKLRITNALIRSLRSLGQKRGAASLFSHHAFAPYAGVSRHGACYTQSDRIVSL